MNLFALVLVALLAAAGAPVLAAATDTAEPSAAEALQAEAEAAVADGLSAEELAALGERAVALATGAADAVEAFRGAGIALRLSQYRLGDDSARLRARAVDQLVARRLDATELSEEAWSALARALDPLRRPEAGEVRADRDAIDHYFRLLERIQEAAASDRLRAIATRLRLENRLVVDRLLGGLSPGERAVVAGEVREGWELWRDLRVSDESTYSEAVQWGLRELELLHLGAPAPEIEGVDLHGRPLKLSEYRGKVVLLDFWASWCPPCVAAIPHQKAMLARFAGRPFAIVGVSGDVEREDGLAAEERHGATWRSFWAYWPGEDGQAPPLKDTWYVRFWPTYYVLDQAGVIRYKGSWDDDLAKIEEVVAGLLASPPRP